MNENEGSPVLDKTETLKALQHLPSAFIRMFMLLFKLKGANKTFIHTVHGSIKN